MNKVYVDQNCSVCTTYGEWISKHDKQLVIESESTETTTSQPTENVDLDSDPIDEATDSGGDSTPPPSSPPSSGSSGGGYGY